MTGSHRAKSRRGLGLIIGVIIAVVVIAIVGLLVGGVLQGDEKSDTSKKTEAETGPTETLTPSATEPASPTPETSAPTTKPSITDFPKPKTDELSQVSDSSPRRITVDGLMDRGFDISVEDDNGHLLPQSGDEVSRWAERGQPGSPGSDTVFLVGSTDQEDAFNGLPEMSKGSEVTITNDSADLTYTVVAKESITNPLSQERLTAEVPGRLVLLGTDGYGAGPDEPVLVVVANLTSVD